MYKYTLTFFNYLKASAQLFKHNQSLYLFGFVFSTLFDLNIKMNISQCLNPIQTGETFRAPSRKS